MENQQSQPGTSLVTERARPRRSRLLRRVVLASAAVAGAGALVGGVLMLLPGKPPAHRPPAPAPAPGPPRALTAVTAGVPAALSALAATIGDREARLRTHPADAMAWAVLGTAYVEQGRLTADVTNYPKAERALRSSLRVKGEKNAEALDGLAALENARRDFAAAKDWGEQALRAAPKRWTSYPPLIEAYNGLGDYEATRKTLDKLMALKPGGAGRPAVMAQAAAVYRDRGWREDASAQLSDAAAIARTPAEQAGYLERSGQLAWERGDREDALRHFEAAVRLDPEQSAALAGQGRALAALGRSGDALKAYQAALAKRPSPQYTLELGELYESLGMGQEARAQYELVRVRAARDTAAGVDDELLLGQLEADHEDPADAVERLRDEYEWQPGIEVADALGWALHRAGDDTQALKFAVIATDKAHGGGVLSALYAYHRGVIERELDLDGSARRHLQQALRINPYFSPSRAASARELLRELGEPGEDGMPPDVM
ncbi:tetratricopeptide repeat protein [Streptomyces olivochromogenes]|uniref:tetratricopeptide repeat protein n=1 Tax=Streptomyces olivochromogenes TaxID=1963 RepID=UPI001F1B31BC|nr:tetratricopeptide repeat protein [Streptomyces olivochromogenes]MCF3129878.1 tetratricopeptide repeat protein [Streptomyces olivochromogenes]